jgi:hypothetical protein
MICDALSRKAASLDTGSTESSASSTISLITDPFFKVSLHIILPMVKGVIRPLSTPFFRSGECAHILLAGPIHETSERQYKKGKDIYLGKKKKKRSCLLGIYKCSKLSKNLVNKFFSNALLNAIIRIFIILKYYN